MNRDKVIELIIGSEKGLNENEPASVGSVSYDGVTQKTYDAYLPRIRETYSEVPASVRDLEHYHVVVMKFYELYLGDYNVWILPDFLQYMYADFVVNAGAAAVKIVQRLAGCDVDGVFGSGTRTAVTLWADTVRGLLSDDPSVDNDLIMEFHNAKLEHYDRLVAANPDTYSKWHAGWLRRANHVLSELGEYFETDEGTPSAMAESDVPVEQPAKTPDAWGAKPKTVSPEMFDKMLSDIVNLQLRVEKLENTRKFGG